MLSNASFCFIVGSISRPLLREEDEPRRNLSFHHMITGVSLASPERSTSLSKAVPENAAVRLLLVMLASVSSRRRIEGAMVVYRVCHAGRRVRRSRRQLVRVTFDVGPSRACGKTTRASRDGCVRLEATRWSALNEKNTP